MVPVSVALKVGTTPATTWLFLFLRTTETEAAADPSATIGPDAVMEEFAATTTVSTKFTLAVSVLRVEGEESEIVFTSSIVDLREAVDTPLELVADP